MFYNVLRVFHVLQCFKSVSCFASVSCFTMYHNVLQVVHDV